MPIDEVTTAHVVRFPDELHGVSVDRLLGWAREPGLAPSPELRELLRNKHVCAAIRDLAARERELRNGRRGAR